METTTNTRKLQPPVDLEAEKGALSCVLLSEGKDALLLFEQLEKTDFSVHGHQHVIEVIAGVIEEGKNLSFATITMAAQGETRTLVSDLLDASPTRFNFETYLEPLKAVAKKRVEFMAQSHRFEIYYDCGRKWYWIQNSRDGWIEVNETSARRMLKRQGFHSSTPAGCNTSPLDEKLMETQTENDVAWAGSLAGYRKGAVTVCGSRVLVTDSPALIVPAHGKWLTIDALLKNLFGHQRPFVFGWLKVAIEALNSQQIQPGQALAIAGERGCGKSLFQNHIITPLLGGRSAKPYRYMSGATDFNGELYGSEHLMVEDEVAKTDIRSRRHFGSRIKDMVANETSSHHAKNRNALTLRPFWRVTISLNDEPENLMILPPIDESVADKVMLLKAFKEPLPMPTETLAERTAFSKAIADELPAFAHHLIHEHEIDFVHKCERFGVVHYHHPELLAALNDLSPEKRFSELLDTALFRGPSENEWTGSAAELERKLKGSDYASDAERILTFSTAAGTYLGRLVTINPDRYSRKLSSGQTVWTILRPYGGAVGQVC